MKTCTHKLLTAVLLTVALAALVTPGAFADQASTAPRGENATGQGNPSSPAPIGEHASGQNQALAAPAALIGEHGTGQNGRVESQLAAPATAASISPAAAGFHWGDAAIGAGFAAALALLGVGAAIDRRRRTSLAH